MENHVYTLTVMNSQSRYSVWKFGEARRRNRHHRYSISATTYTTPTTYTGTVDTAARKIHAHSGIDIFGSFIRGKANEINNNWLNNKM